MKHLWRQFGFQALQLAAIVLLIIIFLPLSVPVLGNLRVQSESYAGSIVPIEDYDDPAKLQDFSAQLQEIGGLKSALNKVLELIALFVLSLAVLSAFIGAAMYKQSYWKTFFKMLAINAGLIVIVLVFMFFAVRIVAVIAPQSTTAMLISVSLLVIVVSFAGWLLRGYFVAKHKILHILKIHSLFVGIWVVYLLLSVIFLKMLPEDPRLKFVVFLLGAIVCAVLWVGIRAYEFEKLATVLK